MGRRDDPILIRAGALPIRYWLTAANSELFDTVDALDALTADHEKQCRRVACLIGDQLVPDASINRAERALLLTVRRRLHGGKSISRSEARRAISLAQRVGARDLAAELVRCDQRGEELAEHSVRLERLVEGETSRLPDLPSAIASDSPVAQAILEGLGVPPDGEGDDRRRRRFFERSWRIVTRASTNPTPRGWMSHLGLMTDGSSGTSPAAFPRMGVECHVHWTESVRAQSRAASNAVDQDWPEGIEQFGANPLRWSEDGEHVSIVLDHHGEPTCVVMRETGFLRSVLESVAKGPETFEQLCADLGVPDEPYRAEVRSFVQHLRDTGVLQTVAAPQSQLTRVQIARETRIAPTAAHPAAGRIDVYRRVESGLPTSTRLDLRGRLLHVLRVLRLIDPYPRARSHAAESAQSWMFADILKASLAQGASDRPSGDATELASPQPSADTRSEQLLEYLRAQDGETDTLNIPLELIAELDSETPAVTWPVDCLVRVPDSSAPFRLVVTGVWPAGTIDSRFSDGLQQAYGTTSRVDSYRTFLRQVETLTGIAFVEILAPPLSDRADNAVRRPAYTSAWTGDPNRDLYLVGSDKTNRYVSPHDIEVASGPSGMESRLRGQRIWPIYHATRTLSHPWDTISHTLLATSPLSVPSSHRRPGRVITLSHTVGRVPRIVVDRDIVLSPAQWLIVGADLWDLEDALVTKVRSLARARRRLGLPRWIEASDLHDAFVIGCDLESIAAIRLIDRMISRHGAFRATEMLPTPEQFLLRDAAHLESDRLSSEMVIRMPSENSFPSLAEQVALDIAGSTG